MRLLVTVTVLYLTTSGVYALSCPNPCDETACIQPTCAGGVTSDTCSCCLVCAKVEGEKCGGAWNAYGECDTGLKCVKDPEFAERDQFQAPGTCRSKGSTRGRLSSKPGSSECKGQMHRCLVAPCRFAKCPNFPDAKCVENYCNGCHANFTVDNGVTFLSAADCQETEPQDLFKCVEKDKFYREGETVQRDCNTCTCANTGDFVCTEMACGGSTELRGCTYQGVTHASGTMYQQECNTCQCHDGVSSCTKRGCRTSGRDNFGTLGGGLNLGQLIPTGRSKKQSCVYQGTNYPDGQSTMQQCNSCYCTDGVWACTRMMCPTLPGIKNRIRESGRTSSDCTKPRHSCLISPCRVETCPNHPKATCVNNYCGGCKAEFFNEENKKVNCTSDSDASQVHLLLGGGAGDFSCEVNGRTYKEGDSFMDDCNRCNCRRGRAMCTKMFCGGFPTKLPAVSSSLKPVCRHEGKEYQVGQSFNIDCNRCVCGPRGNAGCTRKACLQKAKTPGCTYRGKSYRTGKMFNDGCKNCECSDSGKVTCTKKPRCPPRFNFSKSFNFLKANSNKKQNCSMDGKSFTPGQNFQKDPCTSCTCQPGGRFTCKRKPDCASKAKKRCRFEGKTYRPGQWVSRDEKKPCRCCSTGTVECRKNACRPAAPKARGFRNLYRRIRF